MIMHYFKNRYCIQTFFRFYFNFISLKINFDKILTYMPAQ